MARRIHTTLAGSCALLLAATSAGAQNAAGLLFRPFLFLAQAVGRGEDQQSHRREGKGQRRQRGESTFRHDVLPRLRRFKTNARVKRPSADEDSRRPSLTGTG